MACQISGQGVCVRSRMRVFLPSSGGRLSGWSSVTFLSTSATIFSASSLRPWIISQRGLSGTQCRKNSTTNPSTAPMPNANRQPSHTGK